LHYDTLLELPNRIGISLIGYLSSKLAHLLFNLIAINQGRFTCSDLSDSFPVGKAAERFFEIRNAPTKFREVEPGVRVCRVPNFPYAIYYIIESSEIIRET
jgi:hypothetical protein